MNTVGFGAMGHLSTTGRQSETDRHALRGVRSHPDSPSVGFDDCTADRQPQAQSVDLGAEKRLEDMTGRFACQAPPLVADGDLDFVRRETAGGYRQLPPLWRDVAHGFQPVAHQMQYDLLNLQEV